jgi:hypothetical protein
MEKSIWWRAFFLQKSIVHNGLLRPTEPCSFGHFVGLLGKMLDWIAEKSATEISATGTAWRNSLVENLAAAESYAVQGESRLRIRFDWSGRVAHLEK